MTGFGKVTAELPSKKVTVEIKALNSKQLDLSTRIPSIYKEKEMQIRSLLLQSLERGKVEFNIFVEYIGKDTPTQINLAAVENYYNQIKDIADRLNIGLPADWFQTLLRMPDVHFPLGRRCGCAASRNPPSWCVHFLRQYQIRIWIRSSADLFL